MKDWSRLHPMAYFRAISIKIRAYHREPRAQCRICESQYRYPENWVGCNTRHL